MTLRTDVKVTHGFWVGYESQLTITKLKLVKITLWMTVVISCHLPNNNHTYMCDYDHGEERLETNRFPGMTPWPCQHEPSTAVWRPSPTSSRRRGQRNALHTPRAGKRSRRWKLHLGAARDLKAVLENPTTTMSWIKLLTKMSIKWLYWYCAIRSNNRNQFLVKSV